MEEGADVSLRKHGFVALKSHEGLIESETCNEAKLALEWTS